MPECYFVKVVLSCKRKTIILPLTKHASNISDKIFHLPRRVKCPYSELFWSVISCIRSEYVEILLISPYSVRMRVNADQSNPE